MLPIKVVAFDCDGVMFDTKNANTAYYNHILDAMGKPPLTGAQFEYVHMHTVDSSLSLLFPDADERQRAHAHRKKTGYLPFIREMVMAPGLIPLLDRLRPRFKTAVATNRTDTMEAVLATFDLEDRFDMVVTAMDVTHPKPHPEALEKLLTGFNIQAGEMIYIGDSELDEKAAKAANVPFIAFQNPGLSSRHHIASLGEIEKILQI